MDATCYTRLLGLLFRDREEGLVFRESAVSDTTTALK